MEKVNVSAGGAILVVGDNPSLCGILEAELSARYAVTAVSSGEAAIALIDKNAYDLVIADLGLPGAAGPEVLAHVKSRDEFAEVLAITGNANVSPDVALYLPTGAGTYILNPFAALDLCSRVEKMIAMRAFHLKGLQIRKSSDSADAVVLGYVDDLASFYHFTRKLMLTIDISEVMRITLDEANGRADAKFCAVEVCLPGYNELYSMPQTGEIGKAELKEAFMENWSDAFIGIAIHSFQNGGIPHHVYKGRPGEFCGAESYRCRSFPLILTGKTIGSLTVWTAANAELDESRIMHLHILTSIAASVIDHVYLYHQVRLQAKTDSLTGVANHRQYYETLEREISRANRRKGNFALLLADIDNFKRINDTYGHQIGDEVIIDLARRVTANVRSGDVVARYGGEEFGVILPDTDRGGALALSNRICAAIAQTPYVNANLKVPYTASFGLAYYDGNAPIGKTELIQKADKALYKSKAAGKNRVTTA